MAKIFSIYLTTEETEQMDKLTREFNISPTQILRLGLELLFKDVSEKEEFKEASHPQAKPQKMVLDLSK